MGFQRIDLAGITGLRYGLPSTMDISMQLTVSLLRARGSITYPKNAPALNAGCALHDLCDLGLVIFVESGDSVTFYLAKESKETN